MSDAIIANLKAVLSIDAGNFNAGIKSANDSLKNAAGNAGGAGRAFASMDGGFRTAAKGADFLGASLKALAKATVVLGLLDLGKQAIQTATKFDSYNKALESTLGSSARVKKELKDLKEIAKLPGIGLEESIQSFQRFVAVGLDVERSKKLLSGLAKVNAKGGGNVEDFNEGSRQLSQILSAGKITDENLSVLKERLPAFSKILKDTFNTTTAAGLKDAGVNVDQFLGKVIPAMEKSKGVAATAQNSFDNFGSAVTESLLSIGNLALPAVTGGLDGMSAGLSKIAGDLTTFAESPIGKTIADNFGKGFAILGDAAKVVGDVVSDAFKQIGLSISGGDVADGLKSFSAGFKSAATAIKSFVSSNGFKSFVTGFVGGIKFVIDVLRPVGAFIVAQFEKVVDWFRVNMPLIQRTVKTVLDFITQFWQAHGQQIMAVVGPLWAQIKNIISTALDVIMSATKLVMQIITGDWKGAGNTIRTIADEIGNYIKNTFQNMGAFVVNAITAIVSGLVDLNERVGAAAKGIGKAILDGIMSYLSSLWESVKKSVLGAFDRISEIATDVIKAGKSLGSWLIDGIKEGLVKGNLGQALVDMVQGAWGYIQRTTKDLLADTKAAAKQAQDVQDFIKNGSSSYGDFANSQERNQSGNYDSKETQSRLMGAYVKPPLVIPLPKGLKPKITGGDADKINTFGTPDKAKKAKKADKPAWMQQYEALVGDVKGLNQQIVDGFNDPLASLESKYNLLDFSKGGVAKLADQFMSATKSIKNADLTRTISDQNESVRKSILKLRDPSIKGAIAADLFTKAYKDLSLSERERVGQLVQNKQEEDRLTKKVEAGKKATEARKKAEEDRKKGLKDLAEAAAEAAKKESERINELLGSIGKLKNEYKAAISGNDFDKFLAKNTGKSKSEIDIFELARQKDLFDASQAADQAGKLDGLKDRIKGMREELGLVKFANTEARLSFEIFGKSIDQLAPEIQAKIREMVPEFDRLSKFKKLKSQMESVKATIKDTFRDAFQASLQRGESFFATLTLGFKNLLQSIVAEWAANEAVKAIFKLFGAKTDGLSKDTAQAKSDLVKGALSVSAAAVMIREAAKYWEQAAQATPAVGAMGFGGGIGSVGAAGGGVAGIGGSLAGGLIAKQIGGALGSAGGPLGMLAGGAIGSLLGGLFGGGKKKFLGLFAQGGRPPVGYPSIVGDGGNGSGAELFWPDRPGTITSNADSKSILANMGGGPGDVNFNGNITFNDAADVKRIQAIALAKKRQKSKIR